MRIRYFIVGLFALALPGGPAAARDVTSPFPERFLEPSAPLARRERMIRAFDAAVAAAPMDPASPNLADLHDLPITIVALDAGGARALAGQRGFEMHYSGSLLKLAAMYAAFQLRESVNDYAHTLDVNVVDTREKLFRRIADTFDDTIDASVPRIVRAPGVTRDMRVPKYETIFQASIWNGHWRLEFNDTTPGPFNNFSVHLWRMVVMSDNDSAGACVRALGYSWINGLLQAAGFLDLGLTRREGIWLAGDYAAQPTVEIATLNDGDVKQATTTFDMAWLLTLLYDKQLVQETVNLATGQTGNDEMLALLELAVNNPGAPSLLKRVSIPFTVRQAKIGVGELKEDPNNRPTAGSCITIQGCVFSEAAIIEHWSGHRFVVVYQNMLDGRLADLSRIADLIQKTMDGYR